jgi:hypothetical protein
LSVSRLHSFKSFPSLCTRSHVWPQQALWPEGQADSHSFQTPCGFCTQYGQMPSMRGVLILCCRVGGENRTEFCIGSRVGRAPGTLPAYLSSFQTCPAGGRRLEKLRFPLNLASKLSACPSSEPHMAMRLLLGPSHLQLQDQSSQSSQ